jgi:Phospholipase/Carboxylesterase
MGFARVLPLGVLVFAAVGCGGSSDDAKSADGGAGGSGATGGAASGGNAGASGSGGSGGASGAGGSGASGGSAGAGGSAGTPGSGGSGGAPIGPPVPDDCITDVSPAPDHVYDCSGLKFNASVPDACVKFACGLIFDVHGFTMSGAMQENNTKLSELGAQHGYIVVHPTAPAGPLGPSWTAASDDPKVFDFMQRTIAAFHVDAKRVHFTGFSQGGDMSWRFICNHSDVIASAAPAAYGFSGDEKCYSQGVSPAREMPMLYMHGTKDNLVNFSQAAAARDAVIGVLGMQQDSVVETDASHIWTRYKNANGTVFEFIQHDYTGNAILGGHCYPGSTDTGGEPGQLFPFACDPPNAFTWGEVVMQFFLAHPM